MQENIETYSTSKHIMLYILNKVGKPIDFHKLFKIMYFADQNHLVKYGRMISEEDYGKMTHGPVPLFSYRILGNARDYSFNISENDSFKIIGKYTVEALKDFDPDELSITDIECLDLSIEENLNLSFAELTNKSHGMAWNSADTSLDKLLIAEEAGASKDMLEYIRHMDKLNRLSFCSDNG